MRERLPGLIMGVGENVTIEGVVDALLREKGWTLAVGGTVHAAGLIHRLSILDSPAFRGATMSRDKTETATDVRRALNADCALVISGGETQTQIQFLSPQGESMWQVPIPRTDAWSQTRLAVIALEHVRRLLTGVKTT